MRVIEAQYLAIGMRFAYSGTVAEATFARLYKVAAVEVSGSSVYVTAADGTSFDFGRYEKVRVL